MITYAEFAKLSSRTRSVSDQKALQNIQGVPATAGSTLVNTPVIKNRPATSLVELAKRDQQENYYYQNTLNALRKQYHIDDPNARASLASDIQDVALKTSAYYNKYHHTDHITLDDKDWEEIAVTYKALEATKGQDAAIHYLNGRIRDNVSDNQSIFSKQWLGYAGMGAATAGALVAFAGAFKGAWDYAVGNYKDNEHLSGIENFLNAVMDNEVTRYGDDIIRYGSFTPSGIEEAKGYATPYEDGISQLDITQTQGQVEGTDSFFDQIFNVNTIPTAIQQQGFTVASMLAGYGEAKIAGLAFKGLKGATMAAKSAELIKTLDTTRKVLTGIQKAENFTSKFIIPGMTGTAEGLIEGLGTKQQAFQQGAAAVEQAHAQAVSNRVQSILANSSSTIDKETGKITYLDKKGNPINVQELYNQVWKELEPEYKEALEQVDFAASRAGVNNFFMNSAINGLINSTLKAGLQAPGVQRSLQNSRIFKWAQPKGTFDITGAGSDISVASKFGLGKQIWQIAKEPIGEFGEEYIQSLTDAFARGGAESNIHQFIQNKYSGDGSAVVGDTFAGEFGSAWSALADSATSQESLKSGIFGALSSVLGSPSLGRRAVTSDGGKTYFGRGLNAKGEKESNMEWLSRITPWRSGALSAYKESMREKDEMQEQAQQLQDWLRDPTNKSKFDGLVGTATWARGMETAASANDEFGYRNSLLGKTINDAFMLEKLKGTQYYDTVLNQLTEIANLEEGSDKANQYVKELRENVDSGFGDNSSDESIIKSIKSNANRMLNTISKIQEESNNIEQLLGDVDEDTKQALIFGQLNLDDWNERSKQLTTDINKATVNINNSVDDSNDLTKSQQKVLAKYGTFNNAHKQSFKIQETTASLEEDIKNLEKRKANLSDKEKAILKDKKARVNSLKKELDFISSMGDVKENQTTLSEQEIMALDPISRANMLIKGSRKLYTSTHTDNQGEEVSETRAYYSPQQQAVIDNLIQQGTAVDRNFLNKVIDHGRVENSKKAFMEQYNAILTDPNSFNHFVQRAKQQAADVLTKKRYELLENTEDYTKFSNEMDKILTGDSNREQAMIVRGLENSGNENYKRYKATQQTTEELFNKLVNEDKFNDLDGNTADMFAHTVTYLNNQGVDLQDTNAVTEALLKSDEKGNLFQQYVEKINESSPENERTVFTSIPEAIQTYKDVLSDVLKDKQELARNTRPVVTEATSVADSRPASTPDAKEPESKKKSPKEKPGIFGQLGDNSAEDGFIKDEKEGKPIEVEQKVEPVHVNNVIQKAEEEVKRLNNAGHEGVKSDVNSSTTNTGNTTKTINKAHTPIIDNFKNNSSTEVADAAKSSLNYISNASSAYSSNAKHIASKAISDLSENEFVDIEDLKSAITRKANELESSDKEHSIQAATLLRQSIANINTTQVKEDAPKNMSIFAKAKSKSEQVNRNLGQTMNPNAGPNAGFIASINMEYVVNNYPDGPIAKFILNHGILDYLKSNKITGDTNVYFITDDKLTDEVKQDMGNKYTDASMPIIAVVEDKSGQYEIGGKHYQPIAMMPSNNMLHSAGSANMVKVRETAVNNTGVSFIDFDGKPLVTRPYGKGGFIKARSADDNYQGPNNSIQDLLTSDLLSAEQAELQGLSDKDKKNHPLYNKSKKRFIKGLQVKNDGNRKSLIFRQSNLKDNGGNDVILFTTPVGNTLGRTSGKSVIETVNNGESLTHFNSRTEGVERAIATMLKSMPETATGTSETIEEIEGMANTLSKKIGNYIFLSQNDYNYVIKATDNIDGNERIFNISLQDSEGNTIHLANFSKNYSPEAVATELLKNLLTDNGAIRTIGSREFAMWQTNYNDVNEISSNSMAASNVNDWVEDNILEARATALTYRVSGINLNNPFKQDGTPRFTTVANSDNATVSTPVNTPTVTTNQVKTKGAIVDSETGAVVEGTPTINENEAVKTAEAKVEEIVENSRVFELTEEGKHYRNTKTGKLYSRVTSILSADETASGRFDPNSPWILPSTNIGTSVDEFVRDFFAKQKKRKTIKTSIKAEYKGKLIFAQTGAGKTSIADNKDVLDSDYLLGNILQVPASLANNAFSLLSPSAKKEASAKYRQAILDEVAKGKTVVTANLNMLDKADLIVHMEDVDDVTARTNATTRTNQYKNEEYQKESAIRIQKSLEGGKKGIALKKGQYLSDVLLTNPKFNRFNQEVSSYNSIKDAVQDFMSNFGFTFEEFSEKGYSIDYLDRVIKGFNTGDIVDGTGELIAFMMQYNGKAQSIIADLAVKAGDVKKSEIYKDGKVNSSAYKALNKEKYIKVLGRSISSELQTQFDEIKYGKPTKTKVSKINEIIDIIREFLSITLSSAKVIRELSDFSKYVSYNVLADNSSMITASLRKPGDEDAGRVEKVDVYKALSDNPYELDIIQKLSDKGIALAGSTAMAAQGTVYRPVENPLHDLDFETTGNMDKHQLEETITPVIDNLTHIRSIENPDYTTETYLTLDRPYVLERNDTIKGITVIKDATTKEVLGSFVGNNLELREGVQGKLLDFFTKQNPEYAPFKYSFKGKTILMGNYKTAMKAKLEYGRLKDLFDYNRFVKNGRQYPNATTEQWNKFEEQLQILKNRFEAAGIHIVPRDVIADGTLQIADAKENIHDVNVAGTLDLLAYNDKGEFFIFDMKTLHNPNSIESKKHKWGQQTSLYQKFLENKFGIKVKGRFIIPIQVSYPNPNTVNYEQGEGNQVLINGQEFAGANPNLMETIPVDYIEPNIKWEKMTEEEKELASNIAKEAETPIIEEPVEMQVKDEEVPYVDPNIGLSMGSNESSLFDDPLLNGVELPTFTGIERTTVIPTELQWDNLTEKQRKGLMSNNITQEQWETYQDDEMKHELECLG